MSWIFTSNVSFSPPRPSLLVYVCIDRHQTDEKKAEADAKFKLIGEAFKILSDPQKRRQYDSGQVCSRVHIRMHE